MALTCNIDAKGKLVRLIYGILMLLAGVLVLAFWAIPASAWLGWTLGIVLILSGAFGIFEARAGWCVVRAMGMKTPL